MHPGKKIKIIIAEDQEIFRVGFKRIIELYFPENFEFVAEAANGVELVEKTDLLKPNIVITDVKMHDLDGIQACRMIKKKHPSINVIAFSIFEDEEHILKMIRAGASGYIVKSGTIAEIIEAINIVSQGKFYYCKSIAEKIFTAISIADKNPKIKKVDFSIQELKVINLICRQQTTKEIANDLLVATRTVEDYRHQLSQKTGAKNVVGIALYAVINGLVQVSDLI